MPGNESGCAGCHAVQHQAWAGSHHDFTVQEASEQTAAPDDPRHTSIYAVALHDAGRRVEAVRLLESAAQRTGDRDVLLALAAYKRAAGDPAAASRYLTRLAEINPDDPATARDGGR